MNRRDEFVVACVYCGEVVGLKHGGERVPDAIHVCSGHDALDHDLEERSRRAEDPTAS